MGLLGTTSVHKMTTLVGSTLMAAPIVNLCRALGMKALPLPIISTNMDLDQASKVGLARVHSHSTSQKLCSIPQKECQLQDTEASF